MYKNIILVQIELDTFREGIYLGVRVQLSANVVVLDPILRPDLSHKNQLR